MKRHNTAGGNKRVKKRLASKKSAVNKALPSVFTKS